MAVVVKEINKEEKELIPGLPNEIAEICLLHVPYPYHSLVRSVSSSWNRAITNPSFKIHKKHLSQSQSQPHLFVLAYHTSTSTIQCQALDPSSNRWFLLPKIPFPNNAVFPTSFASASLPYQGKLFVMGGTSSRADSPFKTTLVYTTAVNQWSTASDMPLGKSFFAAEEVNGRIVTVGTNGTDIYDHESDTWTRGAGIREGLERYETAVVGGKMFVTEGWLWPFESRPSGWAYQPETDTWRDDMGDGMRDGWTGVVVGVCGKVFSIPEYGDSPVKVYHQDTDTWRCVAGDRFPMTMMGRRPFVARGVDDKIYVVCLGLNVAIGTVLVSSSSSSCKEEDGSSSSTSNVKLTWQVLKAPPAFRELSPSSCQVLYA